jgi:hypothetical protein
MYGTRTSSDQQFHADFGRCDRPLMPWADEFYAGLSKLIDEHGTKLALFYSGGADSELVLRGLLRLGVIPEVHVICFDGGENDEETRHALSFCNSLNITPTVWVHPLEEYVLEQQYLHLGCKYQCTQLAYITVLEYARKVGVPVLMGGEIYVQRHPSAKLGVHTPEEWSYVYREDEDGSTYRYTVDTGHPIINEVFSYTPELMAAWINVPMIRDVISGRNPCKVSLISSKNAAFESQVDFKLNAGIKLHGYEKLMWTNQYVRRILKSHVIPMKTYKCEVTKFMSDVLGVPFEG